MNEEETSEFLRQFQVTYRLGGGKPDIIESKLNGTVQEAQDFINTLLSKKLKEAIDESFKQALSLTPSEDVVRNINQRSLLIGKVYSRFNVKENE